MQLFIFDASKNLGAQQLAGAVENLLDLIRTSSQHNCLIPSAGATCRRPCEQTVCCDERRQALIAAIRHISERFEQLESDVRNATDILSRCVRRQHCLGSMHVPEMDLVFMQAELQKACSLSLLNKALR